MKRAVSRACVPPIRTGFESFSPKACPTCLPSQRVAFARGSGIGTHISLVGVSLTSRAATQHLQREPCSSARPRGSADVSRSRRMRGSASRRRPAPDLPPPTSLSKAQALSSSRIVLDFVRLGVSGRRLDALAAAPEAPVADRWVQAMQVLVGAQAHTAAAFGYEASEKGIISYRHHLGLAAQGAGPEALGGTETFGQGGLGRGATPGPRSARSRWRRRPRASSRARSRRRPPATWGTRWPPTWRRRRATRKRRPAP